MELTENYLVSDFGFKRKTNNKIKFLFNDKYKITLTKVKSYFYNNDTNEIYKCVGDIIKIIAIKEIELKSEKFRAGLSKINLNQGDFDAVFRDNKQTGDIVFISHDKAKLLLQAKFNELISGPLMVGGSEGIYTYRILEANYVFKSHGSMGTETITLTLQYHYKDSLGQHDFWNTFKIYNFSKDDFTINDRLSVSLPVDYLIDKFI